MHRSSHTAMHKWRKTLLIIHQSVSSYFHLYISVFTSESILAGEVVLRLWESAHPVLFLFLGLIQRLERAGQAGRLSYPSVKTSPGGYCSRNPSFPVWTTEKLRSLTSALRPASVACTIQHCRHAHAHINLHTLLSSADSGVLRVTLLNFSPSFSLLVLPLSWQEQLGPFLPAITLLQSLPYSHPFNSSRHSCSPVFSSLPLSVHSGLSSS